MCVRKAEWKAKGKRASKGGEAGRKQANGRVSKQMRDVGRMVANEGEKDEGLKQICERV